MASTQARKPITQNADTSANREHRRQRTSLPNPEKENCGGSSYCVGKNGCTINCRGGCSSSAVTYNRTNGAGHDQCVGNVAATTIISTISNTANTMVGSYARSSIAVSPKTVVSTADAVAKSSTLAHIEQQKGNTVDEKDVEVHDKDVENGGKTVRHRHHRRPLYRRVLNYIRHAWTGVTFSSSNGK